MQFPDFFKRWLFFSISGNNLKKIIFSILFSPADIQFWNNRKSLEGLSVRSVFFNVFQSLIVLLYVLDNETNTIIKISCFVGLGIEIWKINKVVDVSVNPDNPSILGFIPRLQFKDKGSYEESGTKQFDRMAFKYLGAMLFPLAVGYCVYSVVYNEHKGWYSFILSSCYGFLLTFGFIMMTPQLFINYKLKSVAHLPWRMMTYKALNTFIDDIFAFVIKMPTMYRIGCFRDDIVFFIFLYQRYIYRVRLKKPLVIVKNLNPSFKNRSTTAESMSSGSPETCWKRPRIRIRTGSHRNLWSRRNKIKKLCRAINVVRAKLAFKQITCLLHFFGQNASLMF